MGNSLKIECKDISRPLRGVIPLPFLSALSCEPKVIPHRMVKLYCS